MGSRRNPHPAESYAPDAPLHHKIRLRWLGYKHTTDGQVCVIYQDERYFDARGPGYFRVSGWNERMGEIVRIAARTTPFAFENLAAREPVPVTLSGKITYTFDPRPPAEKEIAAALVKLSPDALHGLIQDSVRRLTRVYTPQYTFVALRSATPFPEIEAAVALDFAREELLKRMGLKLSRFVIEQSLTPERTEARLQEAAQRLYNADVNQQLPLNELLLALYTELVEKSKGGSEQLWNMTDLTSLIQRLDKSAAPPTRIIDAAPPAVPNAPPPAETPPPAPDSNKTGSDSNAPPKRSPSYLDPDL